MTSTKDFNLIAITPHHVLEILFEDYGETIFRVYCPDSGD